jgi:hypothetical protein
MNIRQRPPDLTKAAIPARRLVGQDDGEGRADHLRDRGANQIVCAHAAGDKRAEADADAGGFGQRWPQSVRGRAKRLLR